MACVSEMLCHLHAQDILFFMVSPGVSGQARSVESVELSF